MICGRATDKTFYDKTVAGRARAMSRRTKRASASLLAFGMLVVSTASGAAPAHAAAYGGFSTSAIAAPLKLEIFEPAIPIPTEPQAELDFSYTRVLGSSGPASTARSSALWPGAAVGEGLKTFGEQLGLPAALTDGGYPVQANAGFPGDTTQQFQEFFPGMTGRVEAGDKRTVARASYGTADVSDGETGDGQPATTNPLDALMKLFGPTSAPPTNPLGTLGLLVDLDGMTSVSSSDYDGDTVVATATSRIGEVRLLGGLITLTGVNVVVKATSSLDGGAKTSQTVDVGGMTVVGQKFAFGPDGFTAVGKKTPIPGIPTGAADLLKMLGVTIEVPKPDVKIDDKTGSVTAAAVRVSLDTKPLRSVLPELPLDALVNGLPDLPGQASLLKGLLLSLNTIAPKVVLHLGHAEVSAATIAIPSLAGGGGGLTPGATTPADLGGLPELDGAVPPAGDVGTTTPETVATAAGLPALKSIPMLVLLAGLALAAGVGWYLRYAGIMLFGGASACTYGLKAGIPDLRKA